MPEFLRSIYLSLVGLAVHVVRYFFFIIAVSFTIGLFTARRLGHEYSLVEVWLPFIIYIGYSISVVLHKMFKELENLSSLIILLFVSKTEEVNKDE